MTYNKNSKLWLINGILALALAGVFSILLVVLRTPVVQDLFARKDMFKSALVVHVDLSVFVWLLSIAALFWSVSGAKRFASYGKAASIISMAGTIIIFFSPFFAEGEPILNNYMPVITNSVFFIGMSLFLAGVALQMLMALPNSSAIITLVFFVAFGISAIQIGELTNAVALDLHEFYEFIFWSSGHVLQFVFSQIMMIAWLLLAYFIGLKAIKEDVTKGLFALNAVFAVLALYGFKYEINSLEHREFFTNHMIYFGGIVPVIMLFLLAANYKSKVSFKSPEGASFACSIALFLFGGVLAMMIQGVNVVIPAHYHGSIVGVSIALMGACYYYLPVLGFAKVNQKWGFWQPIIYAFGQILHISGLAWSGGYGALRKSPDGALSFEAKMGMGLMGLGGLIAIIGGLVFVIIAFRSLLWYKAKKH